MPPPTPYKPRTAPPATTCNVAVRLSSQFATVAGVRSRSGFWSSFSSPKTRIERPQPRKTRREGSYWSMVTKGTSVCLQTIFLVQTNLFDGLNGGAPTNERDRSLSTPSPGDWLSHSAPLHVYRTSQSTAAPQNPALSPGPGHSALCAHKGRA